MLSNKTVKALSPSIILLSCLALGQTEGTMRIQEAMAPLRSAPSMWVRMDGAEYIGSTSTSLTNDFSYAIQREGRIALESVEYRGLTVTQRVVADGTTLWAYNPLRNEYSAAKYGSFSGPLPDNYRSNLLTSVQLHLTGPTAYSGRLVREIYGWEAPFYTGWMSGAREDNVQQGSPPMKDAVIGACTYIGTPTRQYIVYTLGNPARRSIAFERTWTTRPNGVDGWLLTRIFIGEYQRLGTRDRVVDAVIGIYPNMVPNTASFTFQQPAGARPVAGPKPSGG